MNKADMINTLKIILLFIASTLSTGLYANAADAQHLLRQKLIEISSYSANFTQTVSNELGEALQETAGELSFGKPDKMRWQVLSPDESLSIIDGKHIYNIDPFVEQVTIINQQSVIADNPLALLLNDSDAAWQDVEVKQNGNAFVVTSKAPDANITQLVLFFDEQNRLNRFQTLDIQGQLNDLVFSNIKINPMLSLEHFVAQIPDGYMVDDQR